MAPYPFLSPEWVAEARAIADRYRGREVPAAYAVRMNQVVTDVPFSDTPVHAHLDTSSGHLVMDLGHLENADVTVTLDYETARKLFVEGDSQAGTQAFMSGRIRIDGDIAKMMVMMASLQQETPDPETGEVRRRLVEITE